MMSADYLVENAYCDSGTMIAAKLTHLNISRSFFFCLKVLFYALLKFV